MDWFIDHFFEHYQRHCIKPDMSDAIKEAAQMIMSKEYFTKTFIESSFMFGILEFYKKQKLGFGPMQYNFDDKAKFNYAKTLDPKQKMTCLFGQHLIPYKNTTSLSLNH